MRLLRRSEHVVPTIDLRTEFTASWDSLEIHGQGIHHTADGSLLATEALLRWRRSANELWAAGMILPIAEQTSRIEECTNRATELAISHWARRSDAPHGGRLALNLHHTQLARPTVADEIEELLERHTLRADNLLLEIPDHIGPDACRRAVDHLASLCADGARLALDDHRGEGSATRPSPDWLPTGSIVKLDRALVGSCDDAFGRDILARTADELHAQGYDLVAQAVERPAQLASVMASRIAYTQGCLAGAPQPIG
ncbi:MAG: EAL domain-containing protein [Acidimicrobiales bacterium]|nr:EAL domain-containing protein [Acidimicrobiales bacterium]